MTSCYLFLKISFKATLLCNQCVAPFELVFLIPIWDSAKTCPSLHTVEQMNWFISWSQVGPAQKPIQLGLNPHGSNVHKLVGSYQPTFQLLHLSKVASVSLSSYAQRENPLSRRLWSAWPMVYGTSSAASAESVWPSRRWCSSSRESATSNTTCVLLQRKMWQSWWRWSIFKTSSLKGKQPHWVTSSLMTQSL